jgi:hypothetical protein
MPRGAPSEPPARHSARPDPPGNTSIALRALGRASEGLPFGRRPVELAPDTPSCLVSRAVTLNRLTNSAEALTVAQRAVAIDPDSAWTPPGSKTPSGWPPPSPAG